MESRSVSRSCPTSSRRAGGPRHARLLALPLRDLGVDALDPLERERLRQMVDRYHGDRALRELRDEELDGALGLVVRHEGELRPTVTGLLLIGREAALRTSVPTHEVAFQVLAGTDVKVNEFFRGPLLRTFERVEEMFLARVEEQEIQVGLFRVPVPSLDREVFREALLNALAHRDFTRLGAVHVQWHLGELSISNPGGLVEGSHSPISSLRRRAHATRCSRTR